MKYKFGYQKFILRTLVGILIVAGCIAGIVALLKTPMADNKIVFILIILVGIFLTINIYGLYFSFSSRWNIFNGEGLFTMSKGVVSLTMGNRKYVFDHIKEIKLGSLVTSPSVAAKAGRGEKRLEIASDKKKLVIYQALKNDERKDDLEKIFRQITGKLPYLNKKKRDDGTRDENWFIAVK